MGKVTLAGASDGSLLRLTTAAARPTASRPRAGRWGPGRPSRAASRRGSPSPAWSETLAAGSDDDGWWIVGADAQCGVHGVAQRRLRRDHLGPGRSAREHVVRRPETPRPDPHDAYRPHRCPPAARRPRCTPSAADAAVVCKDRRGLLITRADRAVSELRPQRARRCRAATRTAAMARSTTTSSAWPARGCSSGSATWSRRTASATTRRPWASPGPATSRSPRSGSASSTTTASSGSSGSLVAGCASVGAAGGEHG